jgi:hypothetical protein
MATYQPTHEEEALIRDINEFRSALNHWSKSPQAEERERLRTLINRRLQGIREIVNLAGCHQTVTIGPPPISGGLIAHNIDHLITFSKTCMVELFTLRFLTC